jgi:hypothetical protein
LATRLVVGFSGRSKSGKTELSKTAARYLSAGVASFGDAVRSEASFRNLDSTDPSVLIALGSELVENDLVPFCRKVLAQAGWPSREIVFLDGIRHIAVVDAIKRLVAPIDFRLVTVMADWATRVRRFSSEKPNSITLAELDASAVYQDAEALAGLSDYAIANNGNDLEIIASLVETILNWKSSW